MNWFDRLRGAPKKKSRALEPLRLAGVDSGEETPRVKSDGRLNRKKVSAAFPRFHATAGDQLALRLNDRFAAVRLRLRSAYTPSQPVVDRRLFAGRTVLMTSLIRSIEDERLHTIIYGGRGIGKTSLMHILTDAAREAHYLVSYISCGASSNFDEMFRAVAGDIPLLFHSSYGPTTPEAERGDTIADLLPAGRSMSVRGASDLLSKVVGTRVLIVLDEFDRVESSEFRLSIAEFLKNLSDRSVRVQFLIAGVASNLTELVQHVPSIQRSIFALQVPRMTEAEIRQLVQNGEELSGLEFQEATIEMVIVAANGLPYLASLLSHHAGLRAIDDGRTVVTPGDMTVAVAEALEEMKGRISRRSQALIAGCLSDGAAKMMGLLADLAQLSGGNFSLDDPAASARVAGGMARTRALVEKLAEEGVLLQRQDDEFGRSYHFMEDSVPVYLWLLAAQVRLEEDAGRVPDASVAV